MPKKDIKEFIKEKVKDFNIEEDFDAITFMVGDTTKEMKMTPVKITYGKVTIGMDLTDEQVQQVKDVISKNLNTNLIDKLFDINIQINNETYNITTKVFKTIMKELDTETTNAILEEHYRLISKVVTKYRVISGIIVFINMIILNFYMENFEDKKAKTAFIIGILNVSILLYISFLPNILE